jgi:hypothetical protein
MLWTLALFLRLNLGEFKKKEVLYQILEVTVHLLALMLQIMKVQTIYKNGSSDQASIS